MNNTNNDFSLIKIMVKTGGVLSIVLGLLIGIIGGINSIREDYELFPVIICWFLAFSTGLFALIGGSKIGSNKKQGIIFFILAVLLSILYLIYIVLYGNGIIGDGGSHKVYLMTFFVEGTSSLLFISSLLALLTLDNKDSKL